jgi:hypothetical protein
VLTAATSSTAGSDASNATSETYTYDSESDLLTATGAAGSRAFTYTPDALMASL